MVLVQTIINRHACVFKIPLYLLIYFFITMVVYVRDFFSYTTTSISFTVDVRYNVSISFLSLNIQGFNTGHTSVSLRNSTAPRFMIPTSVPCVRIVADDHVSYEVKTHRSTNHINAIIGRFYTDSARLSLLSTTCTAYL